MYLYSGPIPVTEQFETRICGQSLAVSNPAGVWISVSFECCQVEVYMTGRSLVQRSHIDCGMSLCVVWKPQELGDPGPRWAVAPDPKKVCVCVCVCVYIYILRFSLVWFVTQCVWVVVHRLSGTTPISLIFMGQTVQGDKLS